MTNYWGSIYLFLCKFEASVSQSEAQEQFGQRLSGLLFKISDFWDSLPTPDF